MKDSTLSKVLSMLLALIMLAGSLSLAAFATGDDPDPTNIGIAYENTTYGIKASYLQQLKFSGAWENAKGDRYAADSPLPVGTATNAIHGGHHTRVLRTEYGTYAVIIYKTLERDGEVVYMGTDGSYHPIDLETKNGPEHPYWYKGINYYAVVKITPSGIKVIMEDSYPENDSSQVPEIYNGENGHFFVVLPGEDAETYAKNLVKFQKGEISSAQFKNAAYLAVHDINEATGEVRTDKAIVNFDTCALDDHGYGKPSGVVDLQARKIYCIYDGGYGGLQYPAYFAWFIYDLDTHTWENAAHTLTIPLRKDYYNAYPDGNGGIYFVIQRCVPTEISPTILGFQLYPEHSFAWDAVYYYHIKDMEDVQFSNDAALDRQRYDYVEYEVCPAQYDTDQPQINVHSASHYGNDGCTYLDTNGKLHIIYTQTVYDYSGTKPKGRTSTYHVVMDTATDTEIFRQKIPTTLLPKNGAAGYNVGMGFVMSQGPDGTFYVVHFTKQRPVTVDIWTSPATNGNTFTKRVSDLQLTFSDGSTLNGMGYPIVGNSRDGSVRDGIIPILFNSSTNPAAGSSESYYYFALDVGKIILPHTHVYTDVVTLPTGTEQGYTTHICPCGESYVDDYTESLKLTSTLSLEDSVDINIYVDNITPDIVSAGYSVEYGPNGDKEQVAFSEAEPVSEGKYKFKVASFNANQLSENAYLNLLDGSGQTVAIIQYSVKDYCDTVLNDASADEGLKKICRALMAYGWYAQERFPEGKGPDFASDPYSDAISAVEELGIDDMGNYSTYAEYSLPVSGVSASLALKSKIDLNFFIKDVSELGDFTLTVGGRDWTDYEVVESATRCRVIVKGLRPVDLASDVKLICRGANVTYSPMAYLKRVAEIETSSGITDCINVCKALHLFAVAAKNYFTP